MNLEKELENVIISNQNVKKDYQMLQINGKLYKIRNSDVTKTFDIMRKIADEVDKKAENSFDDFTIYKDENPKLAEKKIEIKNYKNALSNILKMLPDGIKIDDNFKVINIIEVDDNFIKYIFRTRKNKISSFLTNNYNFFSSLIGKNCSVNVGSPICNEFGEVTKILENIIDGAEIYGVEYNNKLEYEDGKIANEKVLITVSNGNKQLAQKEDYEFNKNNKNAIINRILVKYRDKMMYVLPDCISISASKNKGSVGYGK